MIYFVLAALVLLSCNGVKHHKTKISQMSKSQLFDKLEFDFDSLKESLIIRNSTNATCIQSIGAKLNEKAKILKDCPCTFLDNEPALTPCQWCAAACDYYFGYDNFCCDGGNCCCYEQPSTCSVNENCPLQCC
mmetsp:Transcript_43105/g.38341  ORF Transcript_43105/g.38341 Transcript_43105/m.38341 type:complete len:133 (-) Transcript_43105:198-596(-)